MAELGRVGFNASEIRRGISPIYNDNGVKVLNQKCIRNYGNIDCSYARNHNHEEKPLTSDRFLRPGDILINSTGTGTLGRSALIREVNEPTTWDSHLTLVRPKEGEVDPSYLWWAIHAQESILIDRSDGATNQIELSRDTVYSLPLPIDDIVSQEKVGSYLDHETAEIDAAVADLDRYVELLQRRKIQQIRETISGDDSGAFPRRSIQHLFRTISSGTTPRGEEFYLDSPGDSSSIPWVTTSELREKTIFDTNRHVTADALNQNSSLTIHPAGSILIAMYGATIGRFGRLAVNATSNQACCALSNPQGIDDEFFYLCMFVLGPELAQLASGGGQPNINQDVIRRYKTPVPTLATQKRIVAELNREIPKIDSLIADATKLRDLLLKRRSVLITEVVTGRKKV